MSVQIVMDSQGDSRHFFDKADLQSLADAQARFKDLTAKGFRAVVPGESGGPGRLLSDFDPDVEETLFIPPLRGG